MADISNSKSNTIVTGTSGADSIYNRGSNVTIKTLGGNDSITNWFDGNAIDSGTGDDSIVNRGDSVTIDSGSGNDSIYNDYGDYVSISGGADNDYISNDFGNSVTVDGGSGNDRIRNDGGNDISIVGGDGDDYLYTWEGNFTTIDGGAGNDSISISSMGYASLLIDGGADDDIIDGDDMCECTISGGKGNDSIRLGHYLLSHNNLIKYVSGDGNDTVSGFNETSRILIGGGKGTYSTQVSVDDIIVTVGDGEILLSGTAHLPYININGTLVNAGKTINNTVSSTTVSGTGVNDSIENSGSRVRIDALEGNDTIYNKYGGNEVTINGDAGNDHIDNEGALVTIDGGAGNDSIDNYGGYNVTIDGSAGNDTIHSSVGDNVSINGGAGDDYIYRFGNKATLSGFTSVTGDNVTIDGGAGNDTISNYGNKVTINGGAGDDTISSDGSNISINGGTGHDSIRGYNDYSTINGGAGNDIITGNHFRTKIYGGAGNDSINIDDHWGNTISGGDGADTIAIAGGAEHSINGGAGNDRISLSSAYATVRGGAGDDKIYGSTAASHLYQYDSGNDTIYGWSSNDTLTIPGGSFSYKVSGNNGIVTVADSGKITLVGAKGKTVNINDKNYANATNVFTPQDVIKSFMGSLDTTEASGVYALDEAVSVASGGYFKNIQSAINQMVADVESYNDGDKFLREKCGIILGNDDTGAITGSDAGGSVTKTATSVVPEEGDLNNFTGDTFKTNGLTVNLGSIPYDGKRVYAPSALEFSSISSDNEKKYIWQSMQTWWAKNSLDLIAESYGTNYGFTDSSSATVRELYFGFFKESPDNYGAATLAWTANFGDVLVMSVNMHSKVYGSLTNGGNPDGQNISGYSYLDRTLAHEMTHAVMMANIDNFNDLPQFITEGMAELTQGADNRRFSIENLAAAKNVDFLRNSLALNDHGTGTIAVGTDYTDAYAGGYMFLRYLAKQASENYNYVNPLNSAVADKSVAQTSVSAADTSSIKGALLTLAENFPDDNLYLSDYASTVKNVNAKALTKPIMIVGNTNDNSIATGSGNDTVFANTGNDKIIGGNGNDYLGGEAGNDSLNGGTGNDSLNGGTGSDTLTGGKGNDLFVHVADTDFITDYATGQDKIKLTEGKIVGLSLSNSNLVMNVGMYGSITVKNGVDKKITVIDASDTETTIIGTSYDDTSAAKVTLASGVVLADASARTKAIRIVANKVDNTILGGAGKDTISTGNGNDYVSGGAGNDSINGGNNDDYLSGDAGSDKLLGGAGADTLSGGTGNDTLTGGTGDDLFIYSAGNDIITDYASGDKISLGAAVSSATVDGSNTVLTVGKGSLTVKNERRLTIIDKSGTQLTTIVGGIIYDDSSAAKVTVPSGIEIVDASARTKAIQITANKVANSIVGGSGNDTISAGNGNDTVYGGAGDDSLWGGAGADTFIYTAGNDVITDFGDDDLLQITGTFSGTYNKSANTIAFKVGSTANALTLKDFTATTFNVNGNDYRISGTKLVK